MTDRICTDLFNTAERFMTMDAYMTMYKFSKYIHTFIDQAFFDKVASEAASMKERLLEACHVAIDNGMLSQSTFMDIYPHIQGLDGTRARHNALADVMFRHDTAAEELALASLNRKLRRSGTAYKLSLNRNIPLNRSCYTVAPNDSRDKEYYVRRILEEGKRPNVVHYNSEWFTYILYMPRQELYAQYQIYRDKKHDENPICEMVLDMTEESFLNGFSQDHFVAIGSSRVELVTDRYRCPNLFQAIHSQIESGCEYIYAKIRYNKVTKSFEFAVPEPKIYPDIILYDETYHSPGGYFYRKLRSPEYPHIFYVQESIYRDFLDKGWVQDEKRNNYNWLRETLGHNMD